METPLPEGAGGGGRDAASGGRKWRLTGLTYLPLGLANFQKSREVIPVQRKKTTALLTGFR